MSSWNFLGIFIFLLMTFLALGFSDSSSIPEGYEQEVKEARERYLKSRACSDSTKEGEK